MKNNKIDFTKFDLEAYAQEFGELDSKRSRNGDVWMNCLFHDEDTPSLHITDKQVFHCHGCGANGGILDFVKKINNINTKEALDIITDRSGQESVVIDIQPKEPVLFVAPQNHEAVYSYNGGFVLKYRLNDGKGYIWANHKDNNWWVGTGDYEVDLYAPNGLSGTVVMAEGEKDADNLCKLGFNGASTPNGGYKWLPRYTKQLKKSDKVALLNDEDQPGIWGTEIAQRELKNNGVISKRISPLELEPSDIDGYDISDVINVIGGSETSKRLTELIDDEDGWDVLWSDPETGEVIEFPEEEAEVVETELVWESGLGQDYDDIILKAVDDMKEFGSISELSLSKMVKYNRRSGIGMKAIRDRVEERYQAQLPKKTKKTTKSEVVKVKDLNMELDIQGSGYTVDSDTSAIFDDNGQEVIGHFLSFAGIVIDAEASQDTNVKVAIAYNTPQNLKDIKLVIIPKRDLSTTMDIIKRLSGYNINVTQANGMQVVQYLQDLQNFFQDRTITMKSLSRFGWFEDKLMPYEQENVGIVFDSTVAQPTADKLLKTIGSRDKSLELARQVAQHSESSALMLGAAVGSLVLSYINDGGNQSFALNVWAGTGTGKSLTSQAIASMFGYPFKDGGWWADGNSTLNKDIYHNSLLGNLPTFIDDPARNRGYDSNQKRDYVYSATSGQGRGRMARSGEVPRDVKEWCNIMIMTNETIFIDDSIIDGGARARCLEINFDKILGREKIETWVDIMTDNYGHFALDFVNRIRGIGKIEMEERLKAHTRWFNNNGAEGKRANNAAIIALGLEVADETLGLEPIEASEWLAKQIRGASVLSDGKRAYENLIKHIDVNLEVYRSMYDHNRVFKGSLEISEDNRRVVSLPAAEIDVIAKAQNFNVGTLIKWAMENGKIPERYDENGVPQQVLVKGYNGSINTWQIYYQWEGESRVGSHKPIDYGDGEW